MTHYATFMTAGLALAGASLLIQPAMAQSRSAQTTQSVNESLNELNSAQLQMQHGNAQVQADENARLQSLKLPEQSATAPGLENGGGVHENLSTGEPLLFDDHKDVSHDTDDLQRNSAE